MVEKNTKITVLAPEVSMSPSITEVLDFLDEYDVIREGLPEADTGGLELNIIAFLVKHESH